MTYFSPNGNQETGEIPETPVHEPSFAFNPSSPMVVGTLTTSLDASGAVVHECEYGLPISTTKNNQSQQSQLSQPILGDDNDNNKDGDPETPDVVPISRSILKWDVWVIQIYVWLVIMAVLPGTMLATAIGTKFFGSSATYAMYFGIFNSIGGFIGFVVQGYIGKLSDLYGRKCILYLTWATVVAPALTFTFTRNMWPYLFLIPVSTLSGTFGGINGTTIAILADVTPIEHRTVIFGLLYGTVGLLVVFVSLGMYKIEAVYGIQGAIYAGDVAAILTFLWLTFAYKETLPIEIQKENRRNYRLERQKTRRYLLENDVGLCQRCVNCIISPFKILSRIRENKIIFWMAIISFFTQLPECGLQDLAGAYLIFFLNDKYFHDDSTKQAMFTNALLIYVGVAILVGQSVLLPILNKIFKNNDLLLMSLGLSIYVFYCAFGVFIYSHPTLNVAYTQAMIFGVGSILSSITNATLSKRLSEKEQGLGNGIMGAMKGIAYTISPFVFAFLFNLLKNDGILVTMPYIVSFGIFLMSFPILWGPLRRVLNEYDRQKQQQSENGSV